MGIVDDVLDFLIFLVFLGVCIAISFGVVMPIVYNYDDTESALVDKTSPIKRGYDNETSFDGAMSREEVMLMTQVQNYDLPDPKLYVIGNESIVVDSFYESGYSLGIVADLVNKELAHLDPTFSERFEVGYNYGTPPTLDDTTTGNLVLNSGAEMAGEPATHWDYFTSFDPDTEVLFKVRRGSGNPLIKSGSGALEIETLPNPTGAGTHYTGRYTQDIPVKPSTSYRFTGSLSCHRCEGYFSLEVAGTTGDTETHVTERISNSSEYKTSVLEFKTSLSSNRVRISVVKDRSVGTESTPDYLFADDISLQELDGEDPHYFINKR